LASAAAVLNSAGQQQQQQLSHSPMMTAGQSMAAALPDEILTNSLSTMSNHLNPRMSAMVHNGAALKKDKSKRTREQMRQMSRHEISLDDPFMTNNVNIGVQQLINDNMMQEMENWGSAHPWWH
jgi:hypothetical protein